jgi:hypothetical protein
MNRVRNSGVVVLVMLGTMGLGLPHAQAETGCEDEVHLTEDAETRLGGALYEGPMESAEAMPGVLEAMPGMSDKVPEMAGAHEVHEAQRGGLFFMAPNKINHIEARYSDACGIQLLVYNAFTEPISVERFQAFVRIVPEDDSEWEKEVVRFLSPTGGGGILQANGDSDIEGPYRIELYVKFPESDDAELFDIPVDATAH